LLFLLVGTTSGRSFIVDLHGIGVTTTFTESHYLFHWKASLCFAVSFAHESYYTGCPSTLQLFIQFSAILIINLNGRTMKATTEHRAPTKNNVTELLQNILSVGFCGIPDSIALMTTTPTPQELEKAHKNGAIDGIAWHISSLMAGYLSTMPVTTEMVAEHYSCSPELVRKITAAATDVVARSR
jgi:hypothetical protein